MQYDFNKFINFIYVTIGFCLFVLLIYLRGRSFWRETILINFPLSSSFIIFLILLLFWCVLLLYFSFRVSKIKIKSNTITNKIAQAINALIESIKSVHSFLAEKTNFYGKLCKNLILFLDLFGFLKYPFIFVIIFSFIPSLLFLSILIIEIVLLKRINFVFFAIPFLLLPIFGNIIIIITLFFLEHNIALLVTQVNVVTLLEKKKENINLPDFLNSEVKNYLQDLNYNILKIERKNDSNMEKNTLKIHFLYNLLTNYKLLLQNLEIVYKKAKQLMSNITTTVYAILIIYLLYNSYAI